MTTVTKVNRPLVECIFVFLLNDNAVGAVTDSLAVHSHYILDLFLVDRLFCHKCGYVCNNVFVHLQLHTFNYN